MNKKIKLVLIICLFSINAVIFGENNNSNYFSLDFTDCDIKDILFALSLENEISIVTDDSVTGKGDFRYAGDDFDKAFDAFLDSNRLYVKKNEQFWIVSKFRFEKNDEKYSIDAYDLTPNEIIEKISENVDWVITYDSLPVHQFSCHFKNLDKKELVENLGKLFGNYEINEGKNGYHLKKKSEYSSDYDFYNSSIKILCREDYSFEVDVKESDFNEVIENLFCEYRKVISNDSAENLYDLYDDIDKINFCILGNVNNKVVRTVFVGKTFEDTLEKLCLQNGFTYLLDDDIYYITANNESKEEIFTGEKEWNLFSLSYVNNDDFLPLLYKKHGNLETIPLLDHNSFYCKCSDREKKLIESFIDNVDIKKSIYLINLKYIKPQELIEFVPPTVDKSNLFLADNNSRLYFNGTEDAYNNLVEQIKIIDVPVKRLTYDLLILQYDETKQNTWASSIGTKNLKMGDRSNITATLGSVMGFNLNVVAAFGVNFAAELQASIEKNNTKVYADTTLHGVPGKNISFQNTNTYRYRDNNVNPETGEPIYSGVTREIITGIKIDVMGWVSGEGVITSAVTASISRQGIDTSAASGNPPPTTEKIITTEVTGKSGEPIVLSGLILNSSNEYEKGVPLISGLPVIGDLMKTKSINNENSQMIIYLVPHLMDSEKANEENIYDGFWLENKIDSFIKIISTEER